jgi:hypothetical protein
LNGRNLPNSDDAEDHISGRQRELKSKRRGVQKGGAYKLNGSSGTEAVVTNADSECNRGGAAEEGYRFSAAAWREDGLGCTEAP